MTDLSAGYPAGAANDPRAPYALGIDCRDERAITRLADQLASDAFDDMDVFAIGWIRDQCEPDMADLVIEAGRVLCHDADFDRLWNRLRERFIRDEAYLYRAAAEESVLHPGSDDEG